MQKRMQGFRGAGVSPAVFSRSRAAQDRGRDVRATKCRKIKMRDGAGKAGPIAQKKLE
jgi:hypothetical protein